MARLQHRFNDGDAHGFGQGAKFGRVLCAPDQEECFPPFVVGPCLSEDHTAAARHDERVIDGLCHALTGWLVSYQPTSSRHHDREARHGGALVG